MPNLTKEDTSFLMNTLHYWFPCLHLLLIPYSRQVWALLRNIRCSSCFRNDKTSISSSLRIVFSYMWLWSIIL
uniref:Putative ovule protein n=1 Tax=Solanum chacoense TaxID=4108 RepID=A0A0V0GH74_SOLCH